MSFDPKLIHDDDSWHNDEETLGPAWDELDLPGDLQALAEQLRGDAERLAASYPAEASETVLTDTPTSEAEPARRWMSHLALGTAAAVALAVGVQVWFSRPAPQQAAQRNTPPATATTDVPATITPSVFQSLTAPEQEAMLDLMEREQLGQASLSI